MKKMIWTSDALLDDKAREDYQNLRRETSDDAGYVVSDCEWADEVYSWLEEERANLDKEVDGIIIVFGNVGTWRGRRQGYQILGSNIAGILRTECDDAEWYGDSYNIRACMHHHDGTNYALYRVAKDRDEAERIADMIYNREIDEEGFCRRTRSLYPYVAEVYGWKTRLRKLK